MSLLWFFLSKIKFHHRSPSYLISLLAADCFIRNIASSVFSFSFFFRLKPVCVSLLILYVASKNASCEGWALWPIYAATMGVFASFDLNSCGMSGLVEKCGSTSLVGTNCESIVSFSVSCILVLCLMTMCFRLLNRLAVFSEAHSTSQSYTERQW